jgi:hypothetical protein
MPTKDGMVTVVRIDDDVHVRLVKSGRYDRRMSCVICELLDMADKLEKGTK